MYINFKKKYQKIIWVLVGFFLSCFLVDKVFAYNYYGVDLNDDLFNHLWSGIEGKSTSDLSTGSYTSNYIFHQVDYPYVSCYRSYSDTTYFTCNFMKSVSDYGSTVSHNGLAIFFTNKTDSLYIAFSSNNSSYLNYQISTQLANNNKYFTRVYVDNSSWFNSMKSATNFTIPSKITSSFDYTPPVLPDYLQNYKKITLTSDDKYYMLSGLSSGSIYVPTQDFEDYGGRLSYYDNDLSSQPYTSYIQDYYKMPDGDFIRQDFDLSSFPGSDWVMFSKYIYLEGDDNISYDIYVPNDIYDSSVTITPNVSTGGNDFDFEYKDSNGAIQSAQVQSFDLSQDSPLLSNIFSDFSSNTFGLTSIITAPLSLIRSLSSSSCTPLNLPLPFVNSSLTLPCMYSFYSNTFGSLFTLYQTITFGITAYWVIVRIFNMVKDFKNPDHDEIEVIDL